MCSAHADSTRHRPGAPPQGSSPVVERRPPAPFPNARRIKRRCAKNRWRAHAPQAACLPAARARPDPPTPEARRRASVTSGARGGAPSGCCGACGACGAGASTDSAHKNRHLPTDHSRTHAKNNIACNCALRTPRTPPQARAGGGAPAAAARAELKGCARPGGVTTSVSHRCGISMDPPKGPNNLHGMLDQSTSPQTDRTRETTVKHAPSWSILYMFCQGEAAAQAVICPQFVAVAPARTKMLSRGRQWRRRGQETRLEDGSPPHPPLDNSENTCLLGATLEYFQHVCRPNHPIVAQSSKCERNLLSIDPSSGQPLRSRLSRACRHSSSQRQSR